jgi:uncharacterized membrane protein YciS (DUF1049 family)
MNIIIIHFLIILTVFLLVVWLQHNENTRINYKHESIYQQYRLPLLISCIAGLVLTVDINLLINPESNKNVLVEEVEKTFTKKIISEDSSSALNVESNQQNIHTNLPKF